MISYAKRLESMNAKDFTTEISVLPMGLMLELALKRKPVTVYRGDSMWDQNMTINQEVINYESLAKILTQIKEEKN